MHPLSIIIVNYKTPQLLLDCLATIYLPENQTQPEVIVVDNFSEDNSQQLVLHSFPQVTWIQMGYNSGFARANNAGIKQAKGEVLLLLNSDTLNENNAIQHCYERLAASDHIACSVQLLNADRTPQISGNFFMKGGLNHLMTLPYTGRLIRWIGLQLNVRKTNVPAASGTVQVDWINGAFLMVKRSAIQQAGLLDEDFFLYSEEIEWCSRLRKAGSLCIYGDLHVVHLQGLSANEAFGSTGKGYLHLSDRKGFQIMVSGLLRIRKQFGITWFIIHLLAYIFTIPVYGIILLLKTLTGRTKEWPNFKGYTRNVFGLIGLSRKMISGKNYFYKVL